MRIRLSTHLRSFTTLEGAASAIQKHLREFLMDPRGTAEPDAYVQDRDTKERYKVEVSVSLRKLTPEEVEDLGFEDDGA